MNARASRKWFRDAAESVSSANPDKMIASAGAFELVSSINPTQIGKLYFFQYDAKHKATLPYWDKYPMIFPIEVYPEKNAMLGINLHYLPPLLRARLMNALWEVANNDKLDKSTKLKISYSILKEGSQFAPFRPCIKMYLFDHVRSKFLYIKPDYWDMALFLPLARFQKANQQTVWMNSMHEVIRRGGR